MSERVRSRAVYAVSVAWGTIVGSGMLSGWPSFTEFSPVVMPSAVRLLLMFIAGLSLPWYARRLDLLSRAVITFATSAVAVPVVATTISVVALGNTDVLGLFVFGALRTGVVYAVPLLFLAIAGAVVGAILTSRHT